MDNDVVLCQVESTAANIKSDGEPFSSKDSSTNSRDSSTKILTTATAVTKKRKRKNTRILKRGDIRKRNAARQTLKKRLTKIKKKGNKRSSIINNDEESTTNSENSEHANLFNDINWEENLEIDACEELVEEFAPRPRLMPLQKVIKEEPPEIEEDDQVKLETIVEEEVDEISPAKIEEDEHPSEEGRKKEHPHEDTISSANDNIEQEFSAGLQIHVKDYKTTEWNKASILEVDWEEEEVLVHYDIRKPDEWVSMSSQRLSRSTNHPLTASSKLLEKVEIKVKEEEEEKETMKSESKTNQEELIGPQQPPSTIDSNIRNRRSRNPAKFRRYRNGRKNWRFKRQSSLDSSKKFDGKFKVGEKVLAKWSNHRMQKFPAVIKSISGKGAYDLLFYDGFEKTISEDHIYKTTEEEAAKYQDSKPSEADSFVDMDADSKEARRQRKRKTFDDYVFAKDLKRRRRSKCVEDETSKPTLQSLHTHCRKGRKRKKILSDKDDDDAQSPMNDSGTNDYENSNMAGTDSDNYHELFGESEDRWTGEISPDAKPLNIECADGIRKSVVVPDKVLPLGWTKQCINRTGQMWETFLISPEGYRLNTTQDLKEYSRQILGSRTPRNLDFLVNTKILSGLIEKQEHLQPVNNWLPWIGKSGKKKIMAGTSVMSPLAVQNQCRVGRVRTLLPKCRTSQNVTSNEPPAATFSEIWRCPKQGCDKKFRKENLLQMHIKHYHVEFTALVGSAPNVVDLACARSESVNAEHIKSPLTFPPKKLFTKMPSQTPVQASDSSKQPEVDNTSILTTVPTPQPSPVAKAEAQDNIVNKPSAEQRKTTIKTMLPLRQSAPQDTLTTPRITMADSDEVDSEDGQSVEPKPFKPGRGRRKSEKKLNSVPRPDDGYPNSPTYKYTRKKLPVLDKLHITTDSNDSYTEEEKTSPNTEATTDEGGVVIERLKSEEIINCICGFREEDGLMIQCDICMCWQHGLCSGVETDSDVPDRYVCHICRHPSKVRSSKKYSYALHYLSQGKLPSFSFRIKDEKEIQQREMLLKRCYELTSSLRQIQNVERSLKAKINIAEQAGHPKLYLWAKNWDETNQVNSKTIVEVDNKDRTCEENGDAESTDANKSSKADKLSGVPQPEAPIDLEECRMKLLDHIDNYYQQLDDRLMSLQTQIAALESQDADLSSNVVSDKLMKQTILMLLRDLKTVQKIAAVS